MCQTKMSHLSVSWLSVILTVALCILNSPIILDDLCKWYMYDDCEIRTGTVACFGWVFPENGSLQVNKVAIPTDSYAWIIRWTKYKTIIDIYIWIYHLLMLLFARLFGCLADVCVCTAPYSWVTIEYFRSGYCTYAVCSITNVHIRRNSVGRMTCTFIRIKYRRSEMIASI